MFSKNKKNKSDRGQRDAEAEQSWVNFWQAILKEYIRQFPEESKKFMEKEKNKRLKK
ncbi:MAG: hypothetical protein NT155_00690 [Candidatus Staskawiczbacteria bacterium]|nr:hypothetical protein [Candidatus Staskawiczbacteria bacterium]